MCNDTSINSVRTVIILNDLEFLEILMLQSY